MALIAPELIVTWAMRQWFSARLITKHLKDSGYPHVRPESDSSPKNDSVEAPATGNRFLHLLTVLVKGLSSLLVLLRRCPGSLARSVKKFVKAHFSEQSEDPMWTQTHSFFVLMGGFMLYVDGEPCLALQCSDGRGVGLETTYFHTHINTRNICAHVRRTFAHVRATPYQIWRIGPSDIASADRTSHALAHPVSCPSELASLGV
ncbi:uncharacterized protein EDB93DRAFT_1105721 [Suillus bovinus]|uniref:uncharacterized protein n=1 Tax=Suillus bovinus TaxID=48563 RepID=UPI001B86693B|nr:uncharacterized protein EDB93DRAFT_1105721 [Suillus bovinus]KAG2141441.1 hypothetical protein EDB93DRAFT_1105721 [Suillus bovinus]